MLRRTLPVAVLTFACAQAFAAEPASTKSAAVQREEVYQRTKEGERAPRAPREDAHRRELLAVPEA